MVAFDTSVLVRVLIGDDPAQTRKAERAFSEHARGEGVFISLVVLAEIAWVLSAGYALDRATIHERLSSLVRSRGVMVEDLGLAAEALDRYAEGKGDFADYLILRKVHRAHAAPVLTFDKKLGRESGVTLL